MDGLTQSNRANRDHGLKPLKLGAKITLFSLSVNYFRYLSKYLRAVSHKGKGTFDKQKRYLVTDTEWVSILVEPSQRSYENLIPKCTTKWTQGG